MAAAGFGHRLASLQTRDLDQHGQDFTGLDRIAIRLGQDPIGSILCHLDPASVCAGDGHADDAVHFKVGEQALPLFGSGLPGPKDYRCQPQLKHQDHDQNPVQSIHGILPTPHLCLLAGPRRPPARSVPWGARFAGVGSKPRL